jgi:hypothetical protein
MNRTSSSDISVQEARQKWAAEGDVAARRRVIRKLQDRSSGCLGLLLLLLCVVAIVWFFYEAPLGMRLFQGGLWGCLFGFGMIRYAIRVLSHRRTDAAALPEYKRMLAAILPSEFLTADGFLKGHDGKPEPICVVTSRGHDSVGFRVRPKDFSYLNFVWMALHGRYGGAFLGGLCPKILRHRVEKHRDQLPASEYVALQKYTARALKAAGTEEYIDVSSSHLPGALAHETFHDIQGFLYDNNPGIIEKLEQAVHERRAQIVTWFEDPRNAAWTRRGYQLKHIFPRTVEDVPYSSHDVIALILFLDKELQHADISAVAWDDVILASHADRGRAEAIPTLLAAAVEGSDGARDILGGVFADAGLKDTLLQKSDPSVATSDGAQQPPKRLRLSRLGWSGVALMALGLGCASLNWLSPFPDLTDGTEVTDTLTADPEVVSPSRRKGWLVLQMTSCKAQVDDTCFAALCPFLGNCDVLRLHRLLKKGDVVTVWIKDGRILQLQRNDEMLFSYSDARAGRRVGLLESAAMGVVGLFIIGLAVRRAAA